MPKIPLNPKKTHWIKDGITMIGNMMAAMVGPCQNLLKYQKSPLGQGWNFHGREDGGGHDGTITRISFNLKKTLWREDKITVTKKMVVAMVGPCQKSQNPPSKVGWDHRDREDDGGHGGTTPQIP